MTDAHLEELEKILVDVKEKVGRVQLVTIRRKLNRALFIVRSEK